MLTGVTSRVNTKLEARELEVKDLVADLSDGVCASNPGTTVASPS